MIPRVSLARPTSLAEAFAAYAAADGEGAYLAGGTELLQVMKMGLAQFATLISIKGLPELQGIELEPDGTLRIGGGVSHREIERSALVREHLPALVGLESHLANIRVRNQGTLGGNLAFAEPHSDPAAFLLACDARVVLAGPDARRELAIDEFVLGPLYTDRQADELLVEIRVPAAGRGAGRGYDKAKFFERPAVAVAVQLHLAGDVVARARVAVGSITEVPILVPAAAEAFAGAGSEDVAAAARTAAAAFTDLDAVDDLNGAADYKRHLAGVLLERAAVAAYREALAHA